ncbi:MAG TPA: efflux RND transporter periplasmic adaptor subunit [Acidobacteriota bacterium]|jgi:cobalt-zinc-cadmium efflux system membrane fusion protein
MDNSKKLLYRRSEYEVTEPTAVKPEQESTETAATRQFSKRRPYWLWLIGALAVGLLVTTLIWQRAGNQTETKRKAENPAQPSDVVVPTPEQLGQITVSLVGEHAVTIDRNTTGRVAFNEDRLTPVFTPYAGRVVDLLVNKGSIVRRGQALLALDAPELLSAQNDLSSARSDVAKAKISLDAATVAAERARRLHQSEALATKELQQAEADLARAQDEYRRVQALLASVENRLAMFGKSKEEIAGLGSRIDRRVVIHAPISGTVVDRKVGPGQYVKPDAPDPLFLISDLSTLWVLADVFEDDLSTIHLNAPVEITVTAYPNRTFPARISFISPTVDPTTRTVRVRCWVGNQQGLLKPDMFAKIKITAAAQKMYSVIPESAVISEGRRSMVFVEESTGRFRRRQIQTGPEMAGWITAVSGLQPGEKVVTHGALLLNEVIGSKSQ